MSNWFKDVYCAIGVDEPGSMCRTYKEHEDVLRAQATGSFPAPPGGAAPQVPDGALDYTRGGSSTSVYLDPETTDPSEVTRQRMLDFFSAIIPAPDENPATASDYTLYWILGGAAALILIPRLFGGRH